MAFWFPGVLPIVVALPFDPVEDLSFGDHMVGNGFNNVLLSFATLLVIIVFNVFRLRLSFLVLVFVVIQVS